MSCCDSQHAAQPHGSNVCNSLPPPTRFRKQAAQKPVDPNERKLIFDYKQKYRREAIEMERTRGPSVFSGPAAYDLSFAVAIGSFYKEGRKDSAVVLF